jgi:hypothetical protein
MALRWARSASASAARLVGIVHVSISIGAGWTQTQLQQHQVPYAPGGRSACLWRLGRLEPVAVVHVVGSDRLSAHLCAKSGHGHRH